jgi:8-amino-3,8-dideoxy-alpha-D-manno-octulosonate transaminase
MTLQLSVGEDQLAINGGSPCAPGAPASYLLGPQEIGEEEIAAVTAVLKTKNLFRFRKEEKDSPVAQFERQFAQMTQTKHVLAVSGGTSALIAAMVGLGVSSGDEVIVPGYTYIATAAAALALHAIPVICEVDQSLTLDPLDVQRKISPRTRLIAPVHMRGVICKMDQILAIGKQHNIPVLEDCAQANGGSYKGRPVGSMGKAGAFSFQHFKVITAGEGGAVTTSDPVVFERAACYHDSAYFHWVDGKISIEPFAGENYRLSELNGALLLTQLQKRDRILTRCREIKRRMWDELLDVKDIEFQEIPDREGDCGLSLVFFVETADRARRICEALRAEGCLAGSMFDQGIPNRHIYPHWNYILNKGTSDRNGYPWTDPNHPVHVKYSADMCPRTLDYLSRAVAIPITQAMTDEHVSGCIRAVRKVLAHL